jgi:pimeloyl-ACP methyl ester carboxylesterase
MAFGFEIPVFAELAAALQENGWAVLTYDKRSCGPFNGCADNGYPLPDADLTIETFIDDARAGIAFLRARPEVDPGSISILGHSQGAQFVTLMLDEDPRLAKGIMVAGPYRPIDEITRAQLESTIELLGQMGMERDEALALPAVTALVEMSDGLAGLRSGNAEPVAGVSAQFWQSWFDLHERGLGAAARITQPLLVLNGEYDWNVPPVEAEAWGEYLREVGADHELVIVPCITHALNCVSEPDPALITAGDIGGTVATEVIDAILRFLTGQRSGF